MTVATSARPGVIGRFRSRQSGHPSGIVGRVFGRAMVSDTADANDRALELLELTAPCAVLEVGFGQGRTAAILLARGHRVLGVDPSRTMVAQATARNRAACRDGRATLLHGDGITIPFPDRSADAAFTVHTLYFLPDPAATLADIGRVLRPGGSLVVACRTSDEPVPTWFDPAVYTFRTAERVSQLLRAAGFERVDHHLERESSHQVRHFVARRPTDPTPGG